MNRKQIRDKNRVSDRGQDINLQQRPTFESYYPYSTKYYSGIDGEIYIGNKYVDEIYSIDYNITQENMPIFGYNSYLYDEMAVGSRIVSGSFIINFTETNYLGKVLNAIQKRKIIAGSDSKLNEYNHKEPYIDDSMNQSVVASKSPIWDQQFEILVALGEKEKRFEWQKDHLEIIEGVQLTGRSTRLDAAGNPVQEVYSFVARDIRYEPIKKSNIKAPAEEIKREDEGSIIISSNASYDLTQGPIQQSVEEATHGMVANVYIQTEVKDKYNILEITITPRYKNKTYRGESRTYTKDEDTKNIKITLKDLEKYNEYVLKDDIELEIEYLLRHDINQHEVRETINTVMKHK